ncbi:MAG: FHA domain-containing protein [Lentisphaeria bacterium]|nr:FHA domain-containing protein [Lentisphaeria bacterium]
MAHVEYIVDETRHEVKLETVDTTIGRSGECTVQLLHDAELSRIHCSIQRQDDGSYVLVDEASTNGTFLNDERVVNEEKLLQDGDRIRIGHTTLTFREQDMSRTGMIFSEVEQRMKKGEGYHTILGKIVEKSRKHPSG